MKSIALVTMGLCVIGVASAPAQRTPVDKLYDLFVESVLDPEKFDDVIFEYSITGAFDPLFIQHLDRAQARLFAEAREDIEICKRHSDPEWVSKCQQERPAAGYYLWALSLRSVATSDVVWADTPQGTLSIWIRRQCDVIIRSTDMDCVSVLRFALQKTEPLFRAYFR